MKTEEQKAKQAAAHKKWRESEKGKAYYAKKAPKDETPVPASPWPFPAKTEQP